MPFRALNASLCIVHLALAIGFMLYFSSINCKVVENPLDLSLRDHRVVSLDPLRFESQPTFRPSLKTVEVLCVSFFLITAFFHAFYFFTSGSVYDKMIKQRNNYVRWIEYGISSTMMIFIIALMSGVKDANTYIFIGVVNIAMIAQGQSIEKNLSRGMSAVVPYLTGFLLLIAEISVISRDFFQRLDEARRLTGKDLPSWLPSMIFVLFFFYAIFGFVSLVGGVFRVRYTTIEQSYLWLSLISKATLGAFLAYGLGQRSLMKAQPTTTPSKDYPMEG